MRKWVLWAAGVFAVVLLALSIAGYYISRQIEPYLREQTIAYLSKRFASEVDLASLDIELPVLAPWRYVTGSGRGVLVNVTARGIELRHGGRRDVAPLFRMRKFQFRADLAELRAESPVVDLVTLDGLEINIPPKGQRPAMAKPSGGKTPAVVIRKVIADGAKLAILPRDPTKYPLEFAMFKLTLTSAGPGVPMGYATDLTNAKPPGIISSTGSFGPWNGEHPGETPLTGEYKFDRADLGVFKGIGGTLASTGRFNGLLEKIVVDGETRTPDFRLSSSGNPMMLTTKFYAIVDGTNGNTVLQPVQAKLGRSRFSVRGAVAREKDEQKKSIALDVVFQEGYIEDLLKLAMKGDTPILRGPIDLKTKILVKPGTGPVADRLNLDGTFELTNAHFTTPTVQDQIDTLSRRGQGQPKSTAIDEVASDLGGDFRLSNGVIDFSRLKFVVPGAAVELTGNYQFHTEVLDFRGKLRLDARVSQTMSGWKRWVLKPVDPIFAKDGAGTLLNIQVTGTRSNPSFGRAK